MPATSEAEDREQQTLRTNECSVADDR